ncbi:uncharacterized protein MYCFIDRAFT_84722 [Pseudocercospora fijiensis CIRAD86]|uniref:Uncharacterized protein n=1 Tax=Pseudocercospora fijiensis (strain CIRAD86) TaxID=383855 RepID=M3AHQ1_PSEFD|nr:uncharacterized protein MYCFIDRAFT_84722 [Pseudocercospora fijiensis CIRAD86]EME77042.1 hypothetical protein MYCFIDRAFT_84722 [Pseudocercospora fijiensis CIRAD86]
MRDASNSNVLAGEMKHKGMKQQIELTNHQNAERDLLMRQSLEMTVRLLLQNGYVNDQPELTAQMKGLFENNPQLFDSVLPRSEQSRDDDRSVLDGIDSILSDSDHLIVNTGERLLQYHCHEFIGLPIKNNAMKPDFRQSLQAAYNYDYNRQNCTPSNPDNIYWFKRFGYDDKPTQRRAVYRRGDFVRYRGINIGRIDQIFTHRTAKGLSLSMRVTPAQTDNTPKGKDPMLQLPVYKMTNKQITVGVNAIVGSEIWMLPVTGGSGLDMTMGKEAVKLKSGERSGSDYRLVHHSKIAAPLSGFSFKALNSGTAAVSSFVHPLDALACATLLLHAKFSHMHAAHRLRMAASANGGFCEWWLLRKVAPASGDFEQRVQRL